MYWLLVVINDSVFFFPVELPLHVSIVMVLIIMIRIIMVSCPQIVNYDNLFPSFSTLCYYFLIWQFSQMTSTAVKVFFFISVLFLSF